MRFHLEVQDNSQGHDQPVVYKHQSTLDDRGNVVTLGKWCVTPIALERGRWVRLVGVDRLRAAAAFNALPWAKVRAVPYTPEEEEIYVQRYGFESDVLDPSIPGASEILAANKPPQPKAPAGK